MTDATPLPQFVCDLLASPPPRGEGLNDWFFRVSRYLHAFRDEASIIALLEAKSYGQPIKPGEIERQVRCSKKVAWRPGERSQQRSGTITALPNPPLNQSERAAAISSNGELYDLWESSPVRFDDDISHTEALVDALFGDDNPLLCCGRSQSEFDTLPRNEWRGRLSNLAMIVPSAMTARRGPTKENKISAHALSITGPRRYLIIEQDIGSTDEQAAILLHLAKSAPLVLAVHSGSKSIHGWFACQNRTEEQLFRFMRRAVRLGADPRLWTRSQFVRIPDGTRETGERQTVYFFNPRAIK
jgi:hypothetical protein